MEKRSSQHLQPSSALETESVTHPDPLHTDCNIESFLSFPPSSTPNKRLRTSPLTSPTISNISHTSLSATNSTTTSDPSNPCQSSNALMISGSENRVPPLSSNNNSNLPKPSPESNDQNNIKSQDKTSQPTTTSQQQSSQRRSSQMAARGSHWSFVEKARFETALQKYGPFEWEKIIQAVGTRSEKQVKAYAARYRRRKKLAAQAQREATNRQVSAAANMLHPITLGLPRVSLPLDYSLPTYSDVTIPPVPQSAVAGATPHLVSVLPAGACAADSIPSGMIPAMMSTPLQHQQPPQLNTNIVPLGTRTDLLGFRRPSQFHSPIAPHMPLEPVQPQVKQFPEINYGSTFNRTTKPQDETISFSNLADVERLVDNAFQGNVSEVLPSAEPVQEDCQGLDLFTGVPFRQ